MPKLRCVSRYVSARRQVEVGEILDLTEAEARELLNDAPGCWEDADAPPAQDDQPEAKAVEQPPRDTMIRQPPKKK